MFCPGSLLGRVHSLDTYETEKQRLSSGEKKKDDEKKTLRKERDEKGWKDLSKLLPGRPID